jgi:hypothetical protein
MDSHGQDNYLGHDDNHGQVKLLKRSRRRGAAAVSDPERSTLSITSAREQRAAELVAEWFTQAGWRVRRQADRRDRPRPDLTVQKGQTAYAVEVKAAAEGRGDRLVPLWAQACLQAARMAGDRYAPLAVVAAPQIAPRVADQVLAFAAEYAPHVAAGVIDFAGLRRFRGPQLDTLDVPDEMVSPAGRSGQGARARSVRAQPTDLFSDLNQWMLKVLLAPELPERMLTAPRDRYRNASALARAARVSVMSAFRLVQQLEREGYLDGSAPYLRLVRRDDLLHRWQAWAAARAAREVPMRFLLRGEPRQELRRMLTDSPPSGVPDSVAGGRACVALFAAADALHLGFVHGVPPHVYVPRLDEASLTRWANAVPAEPGETPDVILRQVPAPRSVFRGAVQADDLPATDVLQTWLDVWSHPARGREQADLIRRRALAPLFGEHAEDGAVGPKARRRSGGRIRG